jgi:hypothetical protein
MAYENALERKKWAGISQPCVDGGAWLLPYMSLFMSVM